MANKILYGYSGLFDKSDDIMNAAEVVSSRGYKKFDIHTPFPVHGLDNAMKLGPSKLGYFALVFGLSGALMAFLFMMWTMGVDYPLVIGGKPYFPVPAFIPITFEVTVLLASLGTVFAMLVIFFKFPNNTHPLHDTHYMKSVSSDKFGVVIEADDEQFNEDEARKLLEDLGAKDIAPIYFDNEEINHKHKIFNPKFLVFLGLAAVITSGATYFALNKLMFMTPFDWMYEQHRIDAQEEAEFFGDGFSMRPPVDGTVMRGHLPYPYPDEPEKAGQMLINPLENTDENLELGKQKWFTYCTPCHGTFGEGDGRLRGQFPNPPSIHSSKVRDEWTDGRIYHVIEVGQNSMPSYAKQMNDKEKWATILYIRALQRALHAREEDLK